jgi:homoserine O-acetyltransferase
MPVEGKHALGNFGLQSGAVLTNAFLSYEIHGELNTDRSNAILFPTWYGGTHENNRLAIAEGRALDPEKYCIIVPDMFCNGLSSSPSNTPPPHDRARFPLVTPYDNVVAQQRLCAEHFGIERLTMVVGYSMSAQQAFHWAAMYPDMVGCIAPICGTAKTSPHNWLFLEGVKQALQSDAAWARGDYEEPPQIGLRAFSTVYAGWAMSQSYFREGLYQNFAGMHFATLSDFLDFVTESFSQMDANDLLGMAATWQSADISNHPNFDGNLNAALQAITCPAMVMPCETDLYFPPEDNRLEVDQMPNAELRVIPSIYGHLAGEPGLAPAEDETFVDQGLRDLLARAS